MPKPSPKKLTLVKEGKPKNPRAKRPIKNSPKPKAALKKSTVSRIRKAEPSNIQGALARLDIDLDELDAAPRITDSLTACFPAKNGKAIMQIINYLSASDAPCARAWLAAWKSISQRDRQDLPIEAICVRAKVNPLEILGAILVSARNLKAQESALKAIIAHPDVVASTIKQSKGKFGFADRKLIHEAVGFLPTKNGQSIAINIGGNKSEDDDDSDDDDKAFDDAFPTISSKLESWADRRRVITDGR